MSPEEQPPEHPEEQLPLEQPPLDCHGKRPPERHPEKLKIVKVTSAIKTADLPTADFIATSKICFLNLPTQPVIDLAGTANDIFGWDNSKKRVSCQ